jgi:hypothetical protein
VRTITTPQRTLLAGDFAVHLRVEVQNTDLDWIDLSSFDGTNFVDFAEISEETDIPVAGFTVGLRRQVDGVSLAPLVEASPANLNEISEYSPLVTGGRLIRILTACTAPGASPISGDWKLMIVGKIDDVDFAKPTVNLVCRDLGARLFDTFIEDVVAYAEPIEEGDQGQPVEDVMAAILANNDVPGDPSLVTVGSPDFVIRPYRQEQMPVGEALRTLALQLGWDARYRFDASDNYNLTFYDPDRDNITPALTLPPSEYLDVSELRIGDADIRNKIRINYRNVETGAIASHTEIDAASVGLYGPRFMEISEAATSAIDTADEADRMAEAILSDLSAPYATHQIETTYLWPVQLHDIIALPENFVHYDTPQKMAVVGIRHRFEDGKGTTTIRGREKPAGAFMAWLRRGGKGEQGSGRDTTVPVLLNFRVVERTATTATYGWTRGQLTEQVRVGQKTFQTSELDDNADPWLEIMQIALDTPPLDEAEDTLTVILPQEGETLLVQVEARGVDLFPGDVWRVEIIGTPAPFAYEAIATEHDDGTAKLQVTIDDPRGVISNARFWKTIKNIRTGPHAATISASPLWAFNFVQQEKHATLLQIEFVRSDGQPNFWSDVFSFDRDNNAEIQSVRVGYAEDEATVIVDGDTDTDSLWADEDIAGVLQGEFELDYRGLGTDPRFGSFVVMSDPDAKRLFRVYGKNSAGDAGVYREVEIDQFIAPATPAPAVSLTTPVDGDPTLLVTGLSNTQSFKYLYSINADFPTVEDVRLETAINASSLEELLDANLDGGDELKVTVLAYSGLGGAGVESPPGKDSVMGVAAVAPIEIVLRATSFAGDLQGIKVFEIVDFGPGQGDWIADPVGDAENALASFATSIPVGARILEFHMYREYANTDPGVEFPYVKVFLYDGVTLITALEDTVGLGAFGSTGDPALDYVVTDSAHIAVDLFSDLGGSAALRDVKIKYLPP